MISDIDIIIPIEKFDETNTLLTELGYALQSSNEYEIHAEKDVVALEFHADFFIPSCEVWPALNNYLSHTVCGDDLSLTVTETDFYLYHLLHTIKHCIVKGVGLRRIVDLFVLENALKDTVDYDHINTILKENGFYEIKERLLAVKDHWFNGITPENDVLELEEEIFLSGNHGIYENAFKHKFKREKQKGTKFVKLKYLLELAFPSKEKMYHAHPFCEKHHLPIVLCWLYRATKLITSPSKRESLFFGIKTGMKTKIK